MFPVVSRITAESIIEVRLLADMARRLRYTWLMYVLFCGFVALQPGIAHWPAVSSTAILLLVILGTLRFWSGERLQGLDGDEARRACRPFISLMGLQSAVWSAFVAFAFWSGSGNAQLELCLVVGVAGFATGGAAVAAAYPPLAWVQFGVQVLPVMVWSIVSHQRVGYLVPVLVICFILFISGLIATTHRHIQAMFRAQLQLETQSAELTRAKEAAEQASSARAQFVTNMSHEIRTPLHGMLGVAELLRQSQLTDGQNELLSTLIDCGEHLLELVNEILDYSKIVSGRLELEQVPLDLPGLVHEVAAPLEPLASAKGLQFSVACSLEGLRLGDPMRIRQVLANLLNNALKFTENGEVRLVVEPSEAGRIGFSVQDTGIGISETQLSRIFQEFTQADASTTRRFGGTGLGLAISKRLVEAMQGELTVASKPGEGSRFTATIPLPEIELPKTSRRDPPNSVPLSLGLPQGCRILIAEDNAVNRMIVRRFLEETGLTIETADTGRHAVELHAANPYDLILMDCHMPDMDGFEATAAIRASNASDVPILAVTASAFAEDRERCLSVGMNGFLAKPLRRDTLLQRIAMELNKRANKVCN